MFKSEIENYPHFVIVVERWWNDALTHRNILISYDYFHGASVAFSILGRFELSDEMDILKHVMDAKLHYKYLRDRNLEQFSGD